MHQQYVAEKEKEKKEKEKEKEKERRGKYDLNVPTHGCYRGVFGFTSRPLNVISSESPTLCYLKLLL